MYLEAFKELIDCRMDASFSQQFTYAISIYPVCMITISMSYGIAIIYRNLKAKSTRFTGGKNLRTVKFTNDSLMSQAHILFIVSGFLMYSLVSNLAFSMLKCSKLGAGESATHILTRDVSIICYSSETSHLTFMSISIVYIVLYLAGFPAIS